MHRRDSRRRAASRYGGRPKGLERVGGRRVIDRVADALRDAADDLLLIANDPASREWLADVPTANDVRDELGSLGGIHAAIVRAAGPVARRRVGHAVRPASTVAADCATPARARTRPCRRAALDVGWSRYARTIRHRACRRSSGDSTRETCASCPSSTTCASNAFRSGKCACLATPRVLFMNVNTPDDLALAERHAADGVGRRPQA